MITDFPLTGPTFEHQFGVSAYPQNRPIFTADADYDRQTQLRRSQLDSTFRGDYLVEADAAPDCARDLCELYQWISERSEYVNPCGTGFANGRTGDSIDRPSLSLEWLGRNLQEDIVLMANDAHRGFPVQAGCVCFPSGWSLHEKLGKSLLDVHATVPDYRSHLHPPALRLFQRLKAGKTVSRCNWGVRPSSDLDQSPRLTWRWKSSQHDIDANNAGRSCFFRVETQTITRLQCGWIVFTIRTRQCPIQDLTSEQKSILRGVIASCPQETLRYKGIAPMKAAIEEYLDGHG